jgi:hypothetical protein
MMFKLSYDVPANTTLQAQDHQKLKIAKGQITGWIVFMPEESADLLQLNVQYHKLQIFPFSGTQWWYGVYQAFMIPDNFMVPDPPYELDVYAVNTDDTFSHEYNVMVMIEPETSPVGEVPSGTNWFTKLRDMFGGE